jgi:arylsulfatase A-like enzyme
MIAPANENTEWDSSRGAKSYAPVELLDVMPTIMDLTLGLDIQAPGMKGWQGTSLRPIFDDPVNGFVKAMSVSQYPRTSGSSRRMGYTVRTIRYRLTIWCASPVNVKLLANCYRELYDFVADPQESANLASTQPIIAQKMFDQAILNLNFDSGVGVKPWDFEERTIVENLPKQPFP